MESGLVRGTGGGIARLAGPVRTLHQGQYSPAPLGAFPTRVAGWHEREHKNGRERAAGARRAGGTGQGQGRARNRRGSAAQIVLDAGKGVGELCKGVEEVSSRLRELPRLRRLAVDLADMAAVGRLGLQMWKDAQDQEVINASDGAPPTG